MTPEIAQTAVHLRSDASAMLTEASVVIARFDADFGDVPAIPEVLRQVEAAASSQIEHLTAPAQAVAEARLTGAGSSAAAGIAANDRALAVAIARAGRLDGDAILAIHRELLAGGAPAIAGQWRTDQAWIGGSSLGPQHAIFVPPHQDRVAPAMQDLIDFMARADISPLIQAIIAHAQFETIHPFPDGNGRTGRAVMHSLLQAKGLTRHLSVPISVGLAADTGAYFEALGAYRRGELEPIVTVMCRAVHYSIARSRTMIAELIALRASWDEKITARSHSTVWKITGLLLTQPCLDSALLERELGVSNTNALIALKNLEDAGVLTGVSAHRRGRIWRSVAALRCLERFAEPSPRSC